jgi:hypothetical protein
VLCYASLEGAKDAFEFSFVAVPAQREAGVIKGQARPGGSLETLVKDYPGYQKELEQLEREARAGRSYLAGLRRDVVRLGGLAEREMDTAVLRDIADKLDEGELLELKRTFGRRAEKKYALKTQLEYDQAETEKVQEDGAFLI